MLNKYQKSLNFIKNTCMIDFRLLDKRAKELPINKTQLEAYENLKELVDKTALKVPFKHEENYYVCPTCDCEVKRSPTALMVGKDYCSNCGQHLNWAEIDKEENK